MLQERFVLQQEKQIQKMVILNSYFCYFDTIKYKIGNVKMKYKKDRTNDEKDKIK